MEYYFEDDFNDLFIGTILINNGEKYIQAMTYIVREVCDKNLKIIGYEDANTHEFVINREKRKYALKHGFYDYDIDAAKPFKNIKGDILWKVSRYPATKVLKSEEIETYLSINPNDIKSSLQEIRENPLDYIKDSYSRKLK